MMAAGRKCSLMQSCRQIAADFTKTSTSYFNIYCSGNISVFTASFSVVSGLRDCFKDKSNDFNCQIDIMSQIESYKGETSPLMDSLG